MLEWILFAGRKKRIRTLLGSIKPLKTPLRSEHAFRNVRFAFCVGNVLRCVKAVCVCVRVEVCVFKLVKD